MSKARRFVPLGIFVALLVFSPFLAPAFESLYTALMNGLDRALDVLAV